MTVLRRPPSARRGESGQAMVEFMMVLPILLLLLIGIIQFGLLFYNYIDLTSATRDGARKAVVLRLDEESATAVTETITHSTTIVNDDGLDIDITPGGPWEAGSEVVVRTRYDYEVNVMGIVLWDGPLEVEAVATVE